MDVRQLVKDVKAIGKVAEAENLIKDPKVWKKRLEFAASPAMEAIKRGLSPSPYFVEAWSYYHRAKALQEKNLGLRSPTAKSGDDLQDHIPIYDTVRRRYAGFSNVLEQLRYGNKAPKIQRNKEMGWAYPKFGGDDMAWLYVCLAHRITGSGASFEHDHGWRNTIVPRTAAHKDMWHMAAYAGTHPGPSFTSIGNQIPPFNKLKDPHSFRNAGHEYLATVAPYLVEQVWHWLHTHSKPVGIQAAVDHILHVQRKLGCRQFKFVLTAWAMDMAEYLPKLVDPQSDCFHGKNAMEAMEVCFSGHQFKNKQAFYDGATRLFADLTETYPMDVEDASPGCDLIRWLENYVPKKGFQHVHDNRLFNSSSLRYHKGRQPE